MEQKKGSTPDSPWSVKETNTAVANWINRLGYLWVEGQISEMKYKPTWALSYLTLRDTQDEVSMELTCESSLLARLPTPIRQGDRVLIHGKPNFYTARGSFSFRIDDIRHVGIGELLARIEQLRQKLNQEGLFAPERKLPLPYLPNRIGLITGRESAAQRDVVSVAKDRWPEVKFRIINTATQGVNTVPEVIRALQALDADPEVDVIIIARGGGSVEDLLPFSEEELQRAVAGARTPVVSAIGHEPDNPILDNVADLRAATPTDAAKRVVPDAAQERARLAESKARLEVALRDWVQRERRDLEGLRSRPVLANPFTTIEQRSLELDHARGMMRTSMTRYLERQLEAVRALRSQVTALGPAATLKRGYALVQVVPRDGSGPAIVNSIEETPPGSQLRIRVSDGSITAAAMSRQAAD